MSNNRRNNNDHSSSWARNELTNNFPAQPGSIPPIWYGGRLSSHDVAPDKDVGEKLVGLKSPYPTMFIDDHKQVRLTKIWAIGVLGKQHFDSTGPGHYLCLDRELREVLARDFPKGLLEWLAGSDDEVTLPSKGFVPTWKDAFDPNWQGV